MSGEKKKRRRMMRYAEALLWLLDNDDCCWLDGNGMPSVSACLVADIYSRDTAVVEQNLRELRVKIASLPSND